MANIAPNTVSISQASPAASILDSLLANANKTIIIVNSEAQIPTV